MRVVEIERQISSEFLFEADVSSVDPRVFVIATKHAHAGETRERITDWARDARDNAGRRRHDVGPDWSGHA